MCTNSPDVRIMNEIAEIENANTSAEANLLADNFLKRFDKEDYPLFIDDTTLFFFYKGETDSIGIIGDMTDWTTITQFKKAGKSNLFYLKQNYEATARLEYWLMFKKDGFPITDPLNKYKILNGFGEISEIAMPRYQRHNYFEEYQYGKKGSYEKIIAHSLESKYFDYSHNVHVYLPENYDKSKKYNTLYFQDGADYIEFALVPVILKKMVEEGKIDPVIAVFVTPPNRHQPKFPNRMTEYGLNDNYVKFFTEELVEFIDKNYSTNTDKESRLVIGDSYGGLISTYIAFSRPDIFGKAYSQSGYHSFRNDEMIEKIKTTPKKDFRLYIDSGTYERNVGASFLPKDETDFLMGNRRMIEELKKKDYDFLYHEYFEGHTWGNWRRHLIDGLEYFFGKENK